MNAIRLLIDPPLPGVENMAVDEALLASAADDGPTTLRLYGWTPATLSLGYFQAYRQRETHAASADCPVVRRASGGGAIVHDCELTYSFAVPSRRDAADDAARWYEVFHRTLIETLATWELHAELCTSPSGLGAAEEPFLCFERRTVGDVLLEGEKVVGSAQRRRHGAVLQHGSVLLGRSPAAPQLPGIRDIGAVELPIEGLVDRWLAVLAERLGAALTPGRLSEQERADAERWRRKYRGRRWTEKR